MAVEAALAAVPSAGEKYLTLDDLAALIDRLRTEHAPGGTQFKAVTGWGGLLKRLEAVAVTDPDPDPLMPPELEGAGPDMADDHPSAPLGRYTGPIEEMPGWPPQSRGPDL